MEQFRRVPLYESYMANEITEEQYHAELMDYEEAHRKLNEQLTAIMEDTNSAKCVDRRKYATFIFYSILILMVNCVWDAYVQNT